MRESVCLEAESPRPVCLPASGSGAPPGDILTTLEDGGTFPRLIVFDLDYTLWF